MKGVHFCRWTKIWLHMGQKITLISYKYSCNAKIANLTYVIALTSFWLSCFISLQQLTFTSSAHKVVSHILNDYRRIHQNGHMDIHVTDAFHVGKFQLMLCKKNMGRIWRVLHWRCKSTWRQWIQNVFKLMTQVGKIGVKVKGILDFVNRGVKYCKHPLQITGYASGRIWALCFINTSIFCIIEFSLQIAV